MAWQKKHTTEHKEVLDLRQGMHIVPLHDPESGAEHKLQIRTGHELTSCPLCGHVVPCTSLGEIDIQKHIADEIAALELSHANQRAYAAKHKVPVRGR
jgi:hypothetical protein